MRALSILLAITLSAGFISAQASSSPTFFLTGNTSAPGGVASSTKYVLTATLDASASSRCASTRYTLEAGFAAMLDTTTIGRPWVTAVRPRYVPLGGGTRIAVLGHELALGMGTGLKIGGVDATVQRRQNSRVDATAPAQLAPGWKPVTVTAGGSTSTLARGVGILPLLDLTAPAQPLQPFELRYKGTSGDIVVWLLSPGNGPFKIPLPPYGHGLELNLLTLFILSPSVVVRPDGEVRLPLPALSWARPLHFQALAISSNTGYAPGSFTNVARL